MADQAGFEKENRKRIRAVEHSFGPSGRRLYQPGRVLIGEGRLKKQSRRKVETKVFFLFNDVLVYGTIILNSRWHKNQNIVPLEDVLLEDVVDSEELQNQWLICTPRKSFFVSAASYEEKQAWMDHIKLYRANLLQGGSRQAGPKVASSWIPDQTSYKCMRCLKKFGVSRRRHHCRKCGFLVCDSCSKLREVIDHIHPTKRVRVCSLCHLRKEDEEREALEERGDSTGTNSSEDEHSAGSSDEDEEQEEQEATMLNHVPSNWLDFRMGTWGNRNSVYMHP